MKSTLKILFADDDLKYSLVLRRFLEREGYEVTYTGNGTMALKQFPVVKPDLILLDINTPGPNGFPRQRKRSVSKTPPCLDLFPTVPIRTTV